MCASRITSAKFLGAALAAPVAAGLGWIAYSALFVEHDALLPPPLAAERRVVAGRGGRLAYYAAGAGAPMLFVHSINAAASAYEVRPLFERYRAAHRVYALDLPGFGFSDRSAREYSPRLYTDAVLDLLDVIASEHGGAPVDAAALSLGSEFLARAAAEAPARFRSVALITPTGLEPGRTLMGLPGSTRGNPALQRWFDFPLWSRAFFDLLNTRASQRYFLQQTYGRPGPIDAGLLAYDYLSAHRPGAQHAPYAFISGNLFSADMERVYATLPMRVWLAYGTRGAFSRVDPNKVTGRANWTVTSFDTGGLPHFEDPRGFFAAYDAFLK